MHSFALWHLNRLGAAWGRQVADPWAQENLIREDLQLGVEAAFGERPTMRDINRFFKALGTAFREGQTEPAEFDVTSQRLLEVFRGQRELFRYRLMDELVMDLLGLLDQGDTLDPLPSHILVDEYQDLTAGELRLLQELAKRGTMVIAAGDDRQSIYRFREADELALHRFGKVYGVPADPLTESWRCPQRVCDLAEAIARPLPPLPDFVRPALVPRAGRAGAGAIRLLVARSPTAEARWIAGECLRLIGAGTRAQDIMVVTASFYDAVFASLAEAAGELDGEPFKFYDPRETDPAAESTAVRLLGAGARILVDESDQVAWRTLVWATPQLGPDRLTRILCASEGDYRRNLEKVGRTDTVCGRPLAAGRAVLERFRGQAEVNARELVGVLTDALGLTGLDITPLAAAESEASDVTAPANEWATAVVELSQSTLVPPEERPNDIPVRTVHGAKGLEGPVVFLASAIESCFTGRGGAADGIRRLYVAATRASASLYISAPRHLRWTRLGKVAETNVGGLAGLVMDAGTRVGLRVETVA